MALTRFEDWANRLSAFFRERQAMPYAYGTNDCGAFVKAGILAMTGEDVLAIPLPKSRMAAARFLLAGGNADVTALVTRVLGAPLASPRFAGRGDVVAFDQGGEPHLALAASIAAATPARDGMVWVPRVLWRVAWKV